MTFRFDGLDELLEQLQGAHAEMRALTEQMTAKREEGDRELREAMAERADRTHDRRLATEMRRLAEGEIDARGFLATAAGERLLEQRGDAVEEAFRQASELSDEEFRAGVIEHGLEAEFPWAVDDGTLTDDEEPGYDDRLRQADRFKKPQ